jgi:hypothetical protein
MSIREREWMKRTGLGRRDYLERLEVALQRACEQIADGPQEYHEAKTAEDWLEEFLKPGECPDCGLTLEIDGLCLGCAWALKH